MTSFSLRQPHHRGGIRQETVVIPEKMCYNPENAVQAQGGSVMPTLVPILADIRSGAEEAPPVPNTTFGMLFACWAIVIVLLAMVVVFMRAKKKDYALAVLPLTLVPFAHIISGVISRFLDSLIFLSFTQIRVLIDLTAALFSCLLLGFSSRGIPEKRNRRLFTIFCAGFTILLIWVLVYNTLSASSL